MFSLSISLLLSLQGLPELSLPKKANGKKPSHAITRHSQTGADFTDDFLLAEELRKTLVALWQGDKPAISPQSLFQVSKLLVWLMGRDCIFAYCSDFPNQLHCTSCAHLLKYDVEHKKA